MKTYKSTPKASKKAPRKGSSKSLRTGRVAKRAAGNVR